jgi:hypothetical protein
MVRFPAQRRSPFIGVSVDNSKRRRAKSQISESIEMGQTRIEYFQKLNFGGPFNAKLPKGGGSTPYAQVLLDNDA